MLYVVWFVTVFAAYFVKGLAGFGNTPIHTGVMALMMNNADLTPVDFVLTVPANVTLTLRYRRHLKTRLFLPAALISMAAMIPGAYLLKNTDSRSLKILFGFVIILLGADMLRRKTEGKAPPMWLYLILTAVSGLISGLFGIGVLMAATMGRVIRDPEALKANLSAVFVADNAMQAILYIMHGLLTWPVAMRAFTMYPAMLLGLFAGIKCAGKLNERTVRFCAAVLLCVCGVFLIVGNIR